MKSKVKQSQYAKGSPREAASGKASIVSAMKALVIKIVVENARFCPLKVKYRPPMNKALFIANG